MIKIIGCIVVVTLLTIVAVAAAVKTFCNLKGDTLRGMLVITYSDFDTDIEKTLRDAVENFYGIRIVTVYCGQNDVSETRCEQYEICRRFAHDYPNVFCTTYDIFLKGFSEFKGRPWNDYREA